MSQVMSREGFRALAMSWALLAGAVIAGVAIVVGSHWYLERERRENITVGQRMQEARTRVDSARRERENLQASADVFRTLVDRGLLQSERRLDMVELVNALRTRHQLFALDYEIAPQRALALGGNRVFHSVDVLASRVKLRVRALHEGDVLAFIDELRTSQQGFYAIDRCNLRRVEGPETDGLRPRVEADCALEWITLKEKRG